VRATLSRGVALVAAGSAVAAAVTAIAIAASNAQGPAPGERTLRGSWSATGHVQTLPTEGDRPAVIAQLSGAVVLVDELGARTGFHGDAFSFDGGTGATTGRAVWTDTRGDRAFSMLHGDALQAGRHVAGTFTGGTGRYASLTGSYDMTWQYVVSGEDGVVQGRTTDLVVRYQLKGAQP